MSEFDPYHKWFGIPPKDQPPHHYRLLAIEIFESDPDVIDIAADKQMTLLKHCATGPHMEASQRLLNEVASARLCLLVAESKAKYDAELKAKLAAVDFASATVSQSSSVAVSQPPVTDSPSWMGVDPDGEWENAETLPDRTQTRRSGRPAASTKPSASGGPSTDRSQMLIVGGGVAGLILCAAAVLGVVWSGTSPRPPKPDSPSKSLAQKKPEPTPVRPPTSQRPASSEQDRASQQVTGKTGVTTQLVTGVPNSSTNRNEPRPARPDSPPLVPPQEVTPPKDTPPSNQGQTQLAGLPSDPNRRGADSKPNAPPAESPKPPADGMEFETELQAAQDQYASKRQEYDRTMLESFERELNTMRSKQNGKERAKYLGILEREKQAFQKDGTYPWSHPMRAEVAAYHKNIRKAQTELERVFDSAINRAKKDGKLDAVNKLAAQKQAQLAPKVIARCDCVGQDRSEQQLTFYSNGKLNEPEGTATWELRESTLHLRVPKPSKKKQDLVARENGQLSPEGDGFMATDQFQNMYRATFVDASSDKSKKKSSAPKKTNARSKAR